MKKPTMGVRKPRSSRIMVRFTKEELGQVLRDSAGARSLSEYLRAKILSGSADGPNRGGPRGH